MHDPLLSDADVLARARHDPPAFAALFDRHAPAVHRYLDRRVGRDGADDLLAEVFRIAFEHRDSYRPEHDNARPWLFGIASNLVHKAHRSEARRLRALARLSTPREGSDPALTRVEEVLDARSDVAAVVRGLLLLDPRDRDVVALVAWEGFSYEEVAVALDVPVGTVRSRLHRARRILRELQPGCGDERAVIPMPQLSRKAVCE
jgi:RNA polymerase sigma factor (sigma-70 family)